MKKLFLRKVPLGKRGDVFGWVLITFMTIAFVILIRGVVSERLVEIFNRTMGSIAGT